MKIGNWDLRLFYVNDNNIKKELKDFLPQKKEKLYMQFYLRVS